MHLMLMTGRVAILKRGERPAAGRISVAYDHHLIDYRGQVQLGRAGEQGSHL